MQPLRRYPQYVDGENVNVAIDGYDLIILAGVSNEFEFLEQHASNTRAPIVDYIIGIVYGDGSPFCD